MLLKTSQILPYIKAGSLIIDRIGGEPLSWSVNSLDVHLHKIGRLQKKDLFIDLKDAETYLELCPDLVQSNDIFLIPNQLYLASIQENIQCPDFICPDISGKSSLGRIGLTVEETAGWGEFGFCGHFTLEVSVKFPTIVYVGMPIAQVRFHLNHEGNDCYAGKYQNQCEDPIPSKFYQNWKDDKWN